MDIEKEVKRRHKYAEYAKEQWLANTTQATADDLGVKKSTLRDIMSGSGSTKLNANQIRLARERVNVGKKYHKAYCENSQIQICKDLGISTRRYKSIVEDKPKKDPVNQFLTMRLTA